MRVLRFLRPAARSDVSAVETTAPGEALGLDAFAAEAPASESATTALTPERLRIVLIALSALVVLEAIPTVLWFVGRDSPQPIPSTTVARTASAAAAGVSIPIGASSTAPCTPDAAATSGAGVPSARPEDAAKNAATRAAAAGVIAGLISVEAPVAMTVYSDGRLVGTSEADRILLPVGEHEIELVNEEIGLRMRKSVNVQPGRNAAVRVDPPRVPIAVNALPWAEVWIDNQRVGETPIGNLQQTVGPHEIVFRHPELGERKITVLITMKEPARISMDLRKR